MQSQRLVQPKTLELSAVDQEVVLNHSAALKANGFEIEITASDSDEMEESTKRTCRLLTLPTSHTTTFDISDLSELLYLLSETPTSSSVIPRPKKVQRMLAMRACRSSIMRHLAGLGEWNGWREGLAVDGEVDQVRSGEDSSAWKRWLEDRV